MKINNVLPISLGVLVLAGGALGYVSLNSSKKASSTSLVETQGNKPVSSLDLAVNTLADPSPSIPSDEVVISDEQTEYKDDIFRFSFRYPKSLNFETQTPYPGGTVKALTFRVDGITDSTLLSKDLEKSLMGNDLYCNIDASYGSAVCANKKIEPYTNTQGTPGYILTREKQLYLEDQDDPVNFTDLVYAFPLKVDSSYKVIVLSVKYPSDKNLELLRQISDTVKVY